MIEKRRASYLTLGELVGRLPPAETPSAACVLARAAEGSSELRDHQPFRVPGCHPSNGHDKEVRMTVF